MPRILGIGLLGCGAVGREVARQLLGHRKDFEERTGCSFELRHVVVRDAGKGRGLPLPPGILNTNPDRLLADDQTQIMVELIGGTEPAKTLILKALANGKDVVTANKALLALHGVELFAAARQADRSIAFEAAVGGGIPVIEAIRRGLIADEIEAVHGILNGTCNYILTRMFDGGMGYAEALAEAQRLGYAEADPALDVEGTDSAHKLAILASLAMRRQCDFDHIQVRGITDLEVTDLAAGAELGYACKLLASAKLHEAGLDLTVRPTFIRHSHPLAGVSGPFNAISIYGRIAGHTLFYGQGAGGLPTAGAVLADIIDTAVGNARRTFSMLSILPDVTQPAAYCPSGENESRYYLRVGLLDRPGGMGKIAAALGNQGISIASLVQHDPHESHVGKGVPVVATTRPAKDRAIHAAVDDIEDLDVVVGRVVCIPVMNEGATT